MPLNNPVITLPDGTARSFDAPLTVMDVANDIGPGLAKATLAGRVNGELVDASYLKAAMSSLLSLLLAMKMRWS